MMKTRHPIYLSRNAVALITIYERPDNVEDMWISDYPEYDENCIETAKDAAFQFFDQLKGRYNVLFLEALRDEITKRLGSEKNIRLRVE